MRFPTARTHVVIAGGGVAGVELALALHALAGGRVRLTIVAPNADFELRPLRTAEPFAADHVRRHSLAALADEVGAELVADAVERVDPDRRSLLLAGGGTVAYDALVVAVGAQHKVAYSRALTFTGDTSTVSFNGLLADIDEGWTHAVSFVVPPGTTWTLPLYELALMTAREARSMGMDGVRLQIVSPETAPLALFGPEPSAAVAELLATAGIDFRGETYARAGDDGRLVLLPGGEPIDTERIVALPTIAGPWIAGLPADRCGFIPIDDELRVTGVEDVYAAGDGTTFPVKQGGIACQQADAIAEHLAAAAGAPIAPKPFRPVLRGRLLTGTGAQYLEHPIHGGDGAGAPPELRLWSVPRKIDGRYLSPWLAAQEGRRRHDPVRTGDVEVAVEIDARAAGRAAMRLEPYSPLPTR
ncbi:MAG TPA: FAD-dependent oxidoreductase [Baekduia sp.]|uniref:FAD-dependent oxidoreductase n=1 Tax=Baekduia sp. TaxID=2600305 RepID=UPI002C532732|nr:FAD-dependent oxidoreductase [Baekduia sp.]HMJ33491.1 FAD-dependent oxidoreductase [Baekduia sp.]